MNALNTNQVGHESGRFVHLSNEMVLTSINIEFYVSRFEPTVSHNKFFFFFQKYELAKYGREK